MALWRSCRGLACWALVAGRGSGRGFGPCGGGSTVAQRSVARRRRAHRRMDPTGLSSTFGQIVIAAGLISAIVVAIMLLAAQPREMRSRLGPAGRLPSTGAADRVPGPDDLAAQRSTARARRPSRRITCSPRSAAGPPTRHWRDGQDPRHIWAAVCDAFDVSDALRYGPPGLRICARWVVLARHRPLMAGLGPGRPECRARRRELGAGRPASRVAPGRRGTPGVRARRRSWPSAPSSAMRGRSGRGVPRRTPGSAVSTTRPSASSATRRADPRDRTRVQLEWCRSTAARCGDRGRSCPHGPELSTPERASHRLSVARSTVGTTAQDTRPGGFDPR